MQFYNTNYFTVFYDKDERYLLYNFNNVGNHKFSELCSADFNNCVEYPFSELCKDDLVLYKIIKNKPLSKHLETDSNNIYTITKIYIDGHYYKPNEIFYTYGNYVMLHSGGALLLANNLYELNDTHCKYNLYDIPYNIKKICDTMLGSISVVSATEKVFEEVYKDCLSKINASGYTEQDNANNTFETCGDALRFNDGKIDMTLLPPQIWALLNEHAQKGAVKYPDSKHPVHGHQNFSNVRQGMAYSKLLSSFKRHLLAFECGEVEDDEIKSHHLVPAIWNLIWLLWYELNPEEYSNLDDRPYIYTKFKTKMEENNYGN